jgi:predicted small lipoprotein YifL
MRSAAARPQSRSTLVLAAGLITVLLAGSVLAGCGQKGALYLPSQKKSKVPPTQQPQDTPPPQSTSAAPS